MLFENVFTMPAYKKVDEPLSFKKLDEIYRPVSLPDEEINDNNIHEYEPLLTLPLKNNKHIDVLVHGDLFYDKEKEEFYLFLYLTEHDAIFDVCFIQLSKEKMKKFSDYIYSMKKMFRSYKEFDVYKHFMSFIVSSEHNLCVNINDVPFEQLCFISNVYYHERFVDEMHLFSDDKIVFAFFENMRNPFGYLNTFQLRVKEYDVPYVTEEVLDEITYKFIYDLVEDWTPLISIRLNIQEDFEKNRLYYADIYEHATIKGEHATGLIYFDKDLYEFKILLPNGQHINNYKHVFKSKIKKENKYHIYHALVDDVNTLNSESEIEVATNELNQYEKKSLLFI